VLSINKIKYIKSLHDKKNRQEFNTFIIEGKKIIEDTLNSNYVVKNVYVTDEILDNFNIKTNIEQISEQEMKKISALKNSTNILAVVEIPPKKEPKITEKELVLCLESIQDPGNFGTIIRTANWFGIKNILCSLDTVELYNQKVLQATMGAFTGVNVYYIDLEQYIKQYKEKYNNNIYGTFLEGENIYKKNLNNKGILIMGNEGKGISEKLEKLVTEKLLIPKNDKAIAESLNVSIATAVVISEILGEG
jgi:TrmH family RNA methyltransferase